VQAEDPTIASSTAPESTMQRSIFHRALSVGLAAVMTLFVLGSIDEMAQPVAPESQMAQASSTRA